MLQTSSQNAPTVLLERAAGRVKGYVATTPGAMRQNYQAITAEYAERQRDDNDAKTRLWLHPLLTRIGAHSVLDAGCGVGQMVASLLDLGYDAHGFDLRENVERWVQMGLSADRMVVTDPEHLVLPYADQSFDAAVSFGAIEHIGTTDGNATRRPDYAMLRQQWVTELFRVVRVGGHMLLAGPNKGFPIDTAHDLDAASGGLERALSRALGASVHRAWGDYFLWSYDDLRRYLGALPHEMTPLSVATLLNFSRVPPTVRSAVRAYVAHLPTRLLGTGFNPWMAALVRRTG